MKKFLSPRRVRLVLNMLTGSHALGTGLYYRKTRNGETRVNFWVFMRKIRLPAFPQFSGTRWGAKLAENGQKAEFLNFFGDKITFQAAGADFQGYGGTPQLGFYLDQIGLPGTAGVVFRVAHRIAGNRMFSAYIAGP
jgi:hypothetical protein